MSRRQFGVYPHLSPGEIQTEDSFTLSLPMHNKNTVASIISNISTLARLLQRHYSVFHIAEYLQLLEQVYQHP